jgi:hypothetical protein
VSQCVGHWSSSLKYSCVCASTEKYVNTFWWLHWGINLLWSWLIVGWRSTTTIPSCHPSTPTQRYDMQIICPPLKRIIPMWKIDLMLSCARHLVLIICTIHIVVLTCLDRIIIINISLSKLATYIMNLCLLTHQLNLHHIVHHKLTCWWVTAIAELIWELWQILINRYMLHQIQLEWRLHRIWFHHHLLRLASFIRLHLFIAELKKVQQTHPPLVPTGPTSTSAPTPSWLLWTC